MASLFLSLLAPRRIDDAARFGLCCWCWSSTAAESRGWCPCQLCLGTTSLSIGESDHTTSCQQRYSRRRQQHAHLAKPLAIELASSSHPNEL